MARNFYTPINLNGLELQDAAVGNLSTTSINAITSGTGRIQYDSTLNVLKYRDNSGWQTISTGGGSFTLGSTSISLGSTTTTIAGLSSVTSTTFVGALTGNASTATSAGKWTTAVNLAGNSVDGSATVAFANKFIVQGATDTGLSGAQFLGALATGIVKNTTSTGVLSIASAGDFPTLNQNTTGSAGSVANTLTFGTGLTAGGASFNGSAAVTIAAVTGSTSVAGIVQLSDSTSTTSSSLAATPTAVKSAYDLANAALPKAGGTMSGAIAMGGNKITGLGTPTAVDDAATKAYVDNISQGLNAHDAVKYATTGALGTTGNLVGGTITTTYSNGSSGEGATLTIGTSSNWTAITIDGQSLTVTDRVLIKNQASALQNGIYTVTSVGAVGNTTSFVFTRATDNDQVPELEAGDLVYVLAGTSNGGNGFVETAIVTTIGTSSITWSQFSGSSATLAGAGLVTNGTNPNQLDVASTTLSVTSNAVDLATVTPTNSGSAGSGTIVDDITIDTYGRVTGVTYTSVPFTALGTTTSTATATAASGTITSARRVTGAGIGTGTAIIVNHGLGQWVTAQLFDTSGNLVETDVLNASTSGGTTTFTFAASQTLTGFQYVIVG